MPANPIEIHESRLEGVEYVLTNPSRINNEYGKSEMILLKWSWRPDSSGRGAPCRLIPV
jgi:hypothetical protein